MTFIADLMNGLFDLLLKPFGGAAAWAMLAVAVVSGLIMLLLFKISTNQDKLVVAKRRLFGHIYEMGLYQDNLSVLFKIQRDLALANLKYLRVTFPALFAVLIPVVLILAQLDSRFAHRPFQTGETALVTAILESAQETLLTQLTLEAPDGVVVESMPVRDRVDLSATWRIRVDREGSYDLAVSAPGAESWTKQLTAGSGLPRLAKIRERAGLHHALLNPGEKPLPSDCPLTEISLQLPERETRYAGVRMHWLLAFCVISLVFGLAVKDIFKVKI
ncbi:MAG: hypothetical protein ABIF77_19835 [bacterium]